jgi:uncharacterized membrane protein (UPF0182 family)
VHRFLFVSFVEQRGRRTQRILLAALVFVCLLFMGSGLASVVLDRWWFETVTEASVWRTNLVAKTQLGLGVGAVTAGLVGSTVWFVLRVAKLDRAASARIITRYHERMGPGHRWLLVGIAVYLTWHIASSAVGQWQLWLLFHNASDLGRIAPVGGRDLGFHLFRLPFLKGASSFLRQLSAFTLLLAVFGHVASGALRFPGGAVRSSRRAIAHVGALAALVCLLQALHDVFVARPALATNRVGTFDGAGFTAANITQPGLIASALFTLGVGGAAVWLGRTGRWRPLLIALGFAVLVHGVVVVALPALTERFVVAPAEVDRQLWSIENNLLATNEAFGLDMVSTEEVDIDGLATANRLNTGESIARVPLFATTMMAPALQVLAGTTGTRVTDVDLDRYEIDGVNRPVFLAARSARRDDLPESGWVQEHLVYTHGDGVIAVPADQADSDGRPDVETLDGRFGVDHTPLYFGEQLNGWYSIVGTERTQQGGAVFEGEGIAVSSFFRRAVLALTVGESQPLLSSELTDDAELLYRRSVRERVSALAPFLDLDGDPYPIIAGRRVTWVLDGYTTSSEFPASQFVTVSGVPGASDLAGREINYLHAAVKATVDAETGETHLYRVVGDDPFLDVWDEVYPGLLESSDDFPDELRPHLRYPDDLWTVQSSLIGRYHVDTAEQLFNGTGRWAVSAAAAAAVGELTTTPAPSVDMFTPLADDDDGFAAVRPLGPGTGLNPSTTRDELAAIAVVNHSLEGGITLVEPDLRGGLPLLSPQVAQSAIDADPELARVITLLNANGSKVEFGPMSPLITRNGLVWTRSIIVSGTGSSAVPRLFGVAAVSEGRVVVRHDTQDAVAAVADRSSVSVDVDS